MSNQRSEKLMASTGDCVETDSSFQQILAESSPKGIKVEKPLDNTPGTQNFGCEGCQVFLKII